MKKRNAWVFSVLATLMLTSCDYIQDVKPAYSQRVKKEVGEQIETFRITETDKNAEAHRPLFLSEQAGLTLVLKQYNQPQIVHMPREQWIGFFTSWDYAYTPIYSQSKFYVGNGMTVNSHRFQGYKNNVADIYGNDLFTYVQTPQGWKLVNVTATIVFPDDTTSYETNPPLVTTKPETTLEQMEKGFTTANQTLFLHSFLQEEVACFQFEDSFDTPYNSSQHSAKGFFTQLASGTRKLNLIDLKTTVHDQLTAHASADYVIHVNGKVETKGQMLATLAATPTQGWKITSLLLSTQ